MHELVVLLLKGKRDVPRAVLLFARAGDARSMNNLGFIFANGSYGVEKDVSLAYAFFERSASKFENVYSTVGLGDLLMERGDGVDKDTSAALSLYQRAIDEHRCRHAMIRLGLLLEDGGGG